MTKKSKLAPETLKTPMTAKSQEWKKNPQKMKTLQENFIINLAYKLRLSTIRKVTIKWSKNTEKKNGWANAFNKLRKIIKNLQLLLQKMKNK